MSDTDALLAAVLADPDADLPRLVYADWLEERERGGTRRVHPGADRDGPRPGRGRRSDDRAAGAGGGVTRRPRGSQWLAPIRAAVAPLDGQTVSHGAFRRGFVEVVWMPARRFLREADRLFRLAPVRELRVTEGSWLELGELVGSAPFGRLVGLDLSDRRLGERMVGTFVTVEAVTGLRVLRLRGCNLTDRAARELAATPFAWPLRELDVSLNPLSADGLAALRERFGAAVRFDGV